MFTLQSGKQHAVFTEVDSDLELGLFACNCGAEFVGLASTPCPACGGYGGTVNYPPVAGRGECDNVIPFDTTQITSVANYSNPKPGDSCHPLAKTAHPPAIAFQSKQSSTSQYPSFDEVSPSLDVASTNWKY